MSESARTAAHTPGPWRSKPLGGSSMVVSAISPNHNQPKIAVAYDERNGFSIGLPFWNVAHGKREVRYDFVEYSHADARLIAAAPDLLEALQNVRKIIADGALLGFNPLDGDWAERIFLSQQKSSAAIKRATGTAHAAIAKATGSYND